MRLSTYILLFSFLGVIHISDISAQNCRKFHLYASCMQYAGPFYKMDGQSRSNVIGFGDRLIYNVVFYGERQYKLIFCATDLFNPVKYILTDDLTKKVIYDNTKDDYPESIEMTIENTRKILVEVTVLAKDADKSVIENYFGCVGFLMFWRPEKKGN